MIINKNKKIPRGDGFLTGVLLLSLSTVLVKIIGLGVKIPLISTLGAVGMGYFNSAYEIYALLCAVSCAGLPTALSMIISARKEQGDTLGAERAFRAANACFLVLGVLGSGAMLCFSPQIAEAIGNDNAKYSIFAIAPSLLFICLSSGVRGYFQGHGDMLPTSISQLIEAVCKLVFGVGFAVLALSLGATLAQSAAASIFGITLGIILSCIYLFWTKKYRAEKDGKLAQLEKSLSKTIPKGNDIYTLLKIAVPITLGSVFMSSCRIVDMALILRRLQDVGYGETEASGIYGAYTTLAVPVFALVPSLITPISLALIPKLSASVARRDGCGEAEITDRSLRLTAILGIPSAMGIALYSRQILSLLFSGQDSAIDIAAPLLAILGASVLFSGLITTTGAILQAYGQTVRPIVSMAIGAAVKAALAYILIGTREIGVMGAPISTLACDLAVTVINLAMISKRAPREQKFSSVLQGFGLPLVNSLASVTVSFGVFLPTAKTCGERIGFLAAFFTAVAAYAALSLATGAINEQDIKELPFGEKILLKYIKKYKRTVDK